MVSLGAESKFIRLSAIFWCVFAAESRVLRLSAFGGGRVGLVWVLRVSLSDSQLFFDAYSPLRVAFYDSQPSAEAGLG
ncbi:hypothetical protein SAMN05518855_101765 [Paenibacillus sp. CF384]|nr:hypothetical protein SAMN05518855_101765 [Paenibacillus sp. CF384]